MKSVYAVCYDRNGKTIVDAIYMNRADAVKAVEVLVRCSKHSNILTYDNPRIELTWLFQ